MFLYIVMLQLGINYSCYEWKPWHLGTLSHNSLLFQLDYTMFWNYYDWVFSLVIVLVLPCANIDRILKYLIFFLAPPAFVKQPPTFVEVLLGDSLTLSCGAHGNPRPTIVWHKDDSQIVKQEKIKVSCISRCQKLYFNQIYYILCYFWYFLLTSLWSSIYDGTKWSFSLKIVIWSVPHPLLHSLLGSQWHVVFGLSH